MAASTVQDLAAIKDDWSNEGFTWEEFGSLSLDDIEAIKAKWFPITIPHYAVKRGKIQDVWKRNPNNQGSNFHPLFAVPIQGGAEQGNQGRLEGIVNFRFNVQDNELLVHELPECFLHRYGNIHERIVIRECYIALYDMVTLRMLNVDMHYAVTLFTGVPGIGKSVFLVYFMCRFLLDVRFPDKRFAVEFRRGIYCYFSPTNEDGKMIFNERNARECGTDIALFCDIEDEQEPIYIAKWTFIFSSPSPKRYKNKMKTPHSKEYTMPTWSEMELTKLNPNVEGWYGDFVVFGGVPRRILNPTKGRKDLNKALRENGAALARDYFTDGFEVDDSIENYMLVHINPPMVNGVYVFDGYAQYTFASDHVFRMLVERHEAMIIAGATEMLNASGTYRAASAGQCSEIICLWIKPMDGEHFVANLQLSQTIEFQIATPRDELPYRSENLGIIGNPMICHLKTGDALYIVNVTSSTYLLVVNKMTVGASPSVLSKSLDNIVARLPEIIRNQITEKALVFAVPFRGTLHAKQSITTKA